MIVPNAKLKIAPKAWLPHSLPVILLKARLSSPIGLALDSSGNLFEADSGSGNILKFAAADGTKTTFASGAGAIAGLAADLISRLDESRYAGELAVLFSAGERMDTAQAIRDKGTQRLQFAKRL